MKKYTKVGTFHEKKHWNCNKSWTIQKPNKYEILGPYVLGLLKIFKYKYKLLTRGPYS